jgi:hypothetical protein
MLLLLAGHNLISEDGWSISVQVNRKISNLDELKQFCSAIASVAKVLPNHHTSQPELKKFRIQSPAMLDLIANTDWVSAFLTVLLGLSNFPRLTSWFQKKASGFSKQEKDLIIMQCQLLFKIYESNKEIKDSIRSLRTGLLGEQAESIASIKRQDKRKKRKKR